MSVTTEVEKLNLRCLGYLNRDIQKPTANMDLKARKFFR